MTTFLLLVGFTLLATGGAMYLRHAAQHDSRWVLGSLLFPFVVPLYYRRHWEDLRAAALVQSAGLVMLLAGALAWGFSTVQPEGVISDSMPGITSAGIRHTGGFVDSERALKLLVAGGQSAQLGGRLHGQAFRPDRVELIDGVLRMSQGDGFFPQLEIALELGGSDYLVRERTKLTVVPGSVGAPRVLLSWLGDDGRPVTEILGGGYRLDLQVAPLRDNLLTGYLQLVLPDRSESYATGDFTAYTDHLRYRGEEVDRGFDHEDTLEFVAREFVDSQHPGGDIEDVRFSGVVMDSLERRGSATAAVQLSDGRVARYALRFGKGEFGWAIMVPETRAATAEAGYASVYRVLPEEREAAREEAPAAAPAAKAPVERRVSFADLAAYSGRAAVVEYRNGRREEGVLGGLRKERLVLSATKGGGQVEYQLAEAEIAVVRLVGGEVLRLAAAAVAPGTAAAGAAPMAAPGAGLSAPVVAGVDLTTLLNRQVRVVTGDGKTTTGVLRGVNTRNRLVVATAVGGGTVDYSVPVEQVVSITAASR